MLGFDTRLMTIYGNANIDGRQDEYMEIARVVDKDERSGVCP